MVHGKYNKKQSPIGAILTSILIYLLNCDQGCKFHYTLEFKKWSQKAHISQQLKKRKGCTWFLVSNNLLTQDPSHCLRQKSIATWEKVFYKQCNTFLILKKNLSLLSLFATALVLAKVYFFHDATFHPSNN